MNADTIPREFMDSPLDESPEQGGMLTLPELAYLAGTSPEIIQQLLEWEIIIPASQDPEPRFTADRLLLVRRVLRLHAGLGIDFPSMPLILDLLDRIAVMEQRLADLEAGSSL